MVVNIPGQPTNREIRALIILWVGQSLGSLIMFFDQLLMIYCKKAAILDHEPTTHYRIVNTNRLAEYYSRNRIMLCTCKLGTIEVNCKEISALSGLQAANVLTAQYSGPAACSQIQCFAGSH